MDKSGTVPVEGSGVVLVLEHTDNCGKGKDLLYNGSTEPKSGQTTNTPCSIDTNHSMAGHIEQGGISVSTPPCVLLGSSECGGGSIEDSLTTKVGQVDSLVEEGIKILSLQEEIKKTNTNSVSSLEENLDTMSNDFIKPSLSGQRCARSVSEHVENDSSPSKESIMASKSDTQADILLNPAVKSKMAIKEGDAGEVAAKTRKLGPPSGESVLSLGRLTEVVSSKRNQPRHPSTGSEKHGLQRGISTEERSGSEDEGIFEGDMPPCECDECLLDSEEKPVVVQEKKRLSIRQSSWKKIRNIVHWSPFIQQFKRRKYPWIQLAGHQGNFQAGEPGAILKKFDAREHLSFSELMKDVLRPYVPEYRGDCTKDSDRYLQLQDLLCEFEAPCVMDIKMGCRTYLEEELVKAREKPALRKDMYKKMVEVDSTAPTDEENAQKAITKPRYMQWRDEMSSSVELGFRIEGIRKNEGASLKNFKTTKNKSSVQEILHQFVGDNDAMLQTYLRRLKAIRVTQEESQFFSTHEIIGSSLLFVHDKTGRASIWMIDFGKTVPLSDNVKIDHRQEWVEGNNEDGYLTGMDSLIEIFEAMLSSSTNSNSTQNDTSCSTSDSVNTTNTPVTNTSNKDTCNTSVL